jgi:NAD(P)-dependent dehydrogenase (short-subunit alcohol dehydrogenase family)
LFQLASHQMVILCVRSLSSPGTRRESTLRSRCGRTTTVTAMPNTLSDRVAIITGAGRGVGREHALLFAAEGAKVVVNDLGGNPDGTGADTAPAQQVVDEIRAAGGEAVANFDDCSSFEGAAQMVRQAVEAFGDLHVLVNNAGILRDRMITNMSEEEWDAVIQVHLKGHFAPTHHAAAYWRDQSKEGKGIKRAVINTSSTGGLFGQIGQTNYGAAKGGIATFGIIADAELSRYGVRVNTIAPAAATRLTGAGRRAQENPNPGWTPMDAGNVSPFVAYLATEDCPIHGRVFHVVGGDVYLFQPYAIVDKVSKEGGAWTVEELQQQASRLQEFTFDLKSPYGKALAEN